MAKDPAVLWYYTDYLNSTEHMSFEEQGAYVRLLCKQADIGHMSIEFVKRILGKAFKKIWPVLNQKFLVDDDGNFFHPRMDEEKVKRKKFIQHQVYNGSLGGRPKDNPRVNPNETQTITQKEAVGLPLGNRNGIGNVLAVQAVNQKWCTTPVVKFDLTTAEISQAIEFVARLRQIKLDENRIKDLWIAFQTNFFTGEKHYESRVKCVHHFREWLKNPNNGTSTASPKKSNSEQMRDLIDSITSPDERGK